MRWTIKTIEKWGEVKGLINSELTPKQYLKFLEEVGETAKALLKGDTPEIIDGFGDIAVTIIILNAQFGQTLLKEIPDEINYKPGEFTWDDLFAAVRLEFVDPYALNILRGICGDFGYELEPCVQEAWKVIENRTGKMVNGIFVKDK